ncbi:hypothetical protein CMI37_08395 [Candidatus Pacearchaeota archaeon]|nr:hypothetical protein [Candidatus Pacearchaeota archaeon]|tara:strand:- start:604 stop:978 length:375 start_codon:yes stop_codon:yes gene_type:complete
MRINDKKLKFNMLNEIAIEECPPSIKVIVERLLSALNVTKVGNYNKMTELDRLLTLLYWETYDGLNIYLNLDKFDEWYKEKATNPDLISRARRWLIENRYIIAKSSATKWAQQAGDNWIKSYIK